MVHQKTEVMKIENLCKIYNVNGHVIEALKNVSFSLFKGEMIAIMGSSGSGKSTLLNMIGALDAPDSGKIYLDGMVQENYFIEPYATLYRSEKIGFIFQSFNLLKDLSIEDNIALPLVLKGENEDEIDIKVNKQLEKVKLSKWRKHQPIQLSGGQQQRVAISRALITEPEVLLADEPTGNLDYTTSIEILNILKEAKEVLGQSIIIVTHDPMVASFADRVLFFSCGSIVDEYINKENIDNISNILLKFKGVLNK